MSDSPEAAAAARTDEVDAGTEAATTVDTAPVVEDAPAAADSSAAAGRQRGRTVGAAVLGVVAVLVLSITLVAVWAKATVLRAEPVADLVGDALAEPEVQSALAT